ncbi:NAD(P)H-dependent oxidoreductase [Tropicibacter oceani]|uniref:NAD(P)H-dependent oxidoreductase n=1 Tax=Tropicibacter oceani TaxID=3058420 RepID=A0ABY8QCD7_9RHOB|nr:NAD(P)H-dependent oxidoreductase [Tropicibacter oceani]WGW02279.1 NAD(P)H-dependent oxidoreductase [Tropicibacter oceani]
MKTLIVTAHPLADSLCQHLGGFVAEQLADKGHEVTLCDLYASGFQPALTKAERRGYHTGPSGTPPAAMAADLAQAEQLVLVFPTWWFGVPAILKGWFDRIWAPGVAFDHSSGFGPITPRLLALKRVVVVTTLGSPWWVDWLVLRRPVKRVIKHALIGPCTKGCRLSFVSLYQAETVAPARLARFKARIARALG